MGNLVHNQRKGQILFSSGTKQGYQTSKRHYFAIKEKSFSKTIHFALRKQSTN